MKAIFSVCFVVLAVAVTPLRSFAQDSAAITLDEAVRIAIERHQDVGKARASADGLKGKVREVRSQALPNVQIVSSVMRWRDPSLLNASGLDNLPEDLRTAFTPSAVNIFEYGISVKQPIFTQGRIGTALRLASIEAEGAVSEIDRAQQDVALGVVKAFYDLLWAERYRVLVAETQEQKKLHAAMARTRYANGVATEVDVLRSEVAVANGAPDLVRAENAVNQARALLNYYLGRPLDSPVRLAGDFQQKPWEQPNLADLETAAMRRRPEINRLRIAERSADAQLQLARTENRMRVDFQSGYGISSRLHRNLLNPAFARWSAGVTLTLPVFDGFRSDGLAVQAAANQRAARLERDKFERQIRLAIQQGYDELNAAAETVSAARANVSQAERVLQMMQSNYQHGAATTLDIVDAQTALAAARTNLLRGLRDYSVARANLRWSTGQTPWE